MTHNPNELHLVVRAESESEFEYAMVGVSHLCTILGHIATMQYHAQVLNMVEAQGKRPQVEAANSCRHMRDNKQKCMPNFNYPVLDDKVIVSDAKAMDAEAIRSEEPRRHEVVRKRAQCFY